MKFLHSDGSECRYWITAVGFACPAVHFAEGWNAESSRELFASLLEMEIATEKARAFFARVDDAEIACTYDAEVGRYVAGSRKLDVWATGETVKEARDSAFEAVALFLQETDRIAAEAHA